MALRTTPSGAIVKESPSFTTETVRDDLRFTDAQIPMLDARDAVTLSTVPLRPLQRYCGRTIFAFASSDLVDDCIWNQDRWSEALNQVEPADAGKQHDWRGVDDPRLTHDGFRPVAPRPSLAPRGYGDVRVRR